VKEREDGRESGRDRGLNGEGGAGGTGPVLYKEKKEVRYWREGKERIKTEAWVGEYAGGLVSQSKSARQEGVVNGNVWDRVGLAEREGETGAVGKPSRTGN